MTIKTLILARLREIEDKEKIKILYAVESGSRGWGFESKDSDYDVRFIYIHPLEWYLSIEEGRDVIEYPSSNKLDISGWDIKKTLKLFKNSNPPLYEWLISPIVYREEGNFAKKLRELTPKFYSSVSSMHHYLSMARGNYKAYLMDQKVKIKKYFYVLRPVFACMWIKKHKTMPPMEFEKLFTGQKLDKKVSNKVQKLLEKKRSGDELDQGDRVEIINDFLEEKIKHFENYANKLGSRQHLKNDLLDKLFRDTIKEWQNEFILA